MDALALDHWEAQKNRFRKKTAGGVELAVSLDRGTFLRDGDVLLWDATAARAVVARISLRDVMIIHLDGMAGAAARDRAAHLRRARPRARQPALAGAGQGQPRVRAAHRRPQGDGSVMNTHRFEGIRYEFVPGGEIVPYLAPHESRRLFGGAEGPVHSHTHEQYVAVDGETGETYGRPPVRAHSHSHPHPHPHTDTDPHE